MATESEMQYMQDHVDDTQVPRIIISSIICAVLTCICVGLRFVARRLNRAGLGKDDYCLVIGLFLYVTYLIVLCLATGFGLGKHVIVVDNPKMLTILILCDENLYVVGILFIKYSILLLYQRIFPGRSFHKFLLATALVILAWALAAFFCDTFTCYPIESQWEPSIPGRCINYGTVTFVIGIANVIIDFILFVLPLPILWKLQMSTWRKILFSFALGAGSSACVASIVRLTYAKDTLSTFDKTWDSVPVGILSGVEMCTAIIACCFATYRPVVDRVFLRNAAHSKGPSRPSGLRGTIFTPNHASRRHGWDKVVVQHDIEIELESREDLSPPVATADISWVPLRNLNTHDVSALPDGKDIVATDHWYGSPSQNWRAHITTPLPGRSHVQ
ncbi:hypothetical protein F4778DRAFT_723921 [Xylariomycetidae sp. FL2044]|nr:hypothetical protein F4778DRAFT_723921 [Xylariomycetidae sp. FL2044]